VPEFSIVTVQYPSPLGPLDDSPVGGPQPSGFVDGNITAVLVNNRGVFVELALAADLRFQFTLYLEEPAVGVSRDVWMRRGAMLSLAQRAFTGRDLVQLKIEADQQVTSIRLSK
jgi:hypothetical protein